MKQSEPHYNIHILTGKVHSGKTSFLLRLTERLRMERISMAGFLCRGSFIGGKRSSFTMVDLQDGTSQILATIEKREGWIRFGRFYFNPDAFAEGQEILRRGLEQGEDLVVLDEVGPFELEGGGWSPILEQLGKEYDICQIWVVREQALESVLKKWKIPPVNVFRADPQVEEIIIQSVLSHVRNDEISPASRGRRGPGDRINPDPGTRPRGGPGKNSCSTG